jgi:hypothetical protein
MPRLAISKLFLFFLEKILNGGFLSATAMRKLISTGVTGGSKKRQYK